MLMTLSGLGLTTLGSLATWSFWIRKAKKRKRPKKAAGTGVGIGAPAR